MLMTVIAVRLIDQETTVLVLQVSNRKKMLMETNWLNVLKSLVKLKDVNNALMMIKILVMFVLITIGEMIARNATNALNGAKFVILQMDVISA